jgi:CBS domain-containing protein
MLVDSIMTRAVVSIRADATVREAARLMAAKGIGSLVITSGGEAVGLLTERDLTTRVLAAARDPDATLVSAVMSRPLATVAPSAQIEEAVEKMRELRVKRLVVVLDGDLRGIVTVTDVAHAMPGLSKSLVESWVKARWEG